MGIGPWGNPNTHVTFYDDYWKERWFGPDGRAVKDRHWTDHSNPKNHTNPHDQTWDWSDPDHPGLNTPTPPTTPPGNPPTSEGEEPWYPEENKNSSNDEKEENKKESSSFWNAVAGTVIIVGAGLTLLWLVSNDASLVGAADNVAIVPTIEAIKYGAELFAS